MLRALSWYWASWIHVCGSAGNASTASSRAFCAATGLPAASSIAFRTTYGRGDSGSMSCARSAALRASATWLLAARSRARSLSRSERSGCQIDQQQRAATIAASAASSGRGERCGPEWLGASAPGGGSIGGGGGSTGGEGGPTGGGGKSDSG